MSLNLPSPPVQGLLDVIDKAGQPTAFRARFGQVWLEWLRVLWLVVFDQQNSGTTAQRPTEDLYEGKRYYDTDLGAAIYWTGAGWSDENGSGATVDRPATGLYVSRYYFDTDLGMPIWWNGTDWTDATGAVV